MRKLFAALIGLLYAVSLYSTDFSGIYSYNKGINKENGTLTLVHFKPDSAFYYLNCTSGNPDFFFTNLKGFLKVDTTDMSYKKDSCGIRFSFAGSTVVISQNEKCKHEFNVNGKYKKTSPLVKKTTTWMTEYSEKNAVVKKDSAYIYSAPHMASKQLGMLDKEQAVKVLDEVNGFFLLEIAKKKNEFFWTPKKNVLINK